MAPLEYLRPPQISLVDFQLGDLAPFKREKAFDPSASADMRIFYVGRDDVHGVMKYLLARCSRSLYFNMYGYDDEELDQIIQGLIVSEHVYVQGTLDRGQAGGVHERKILEAWGDSVRSSFAIGESATHQISHTKGGVIDGKVAFEGSTNWSTAGEGVFVNGAFGGKGYKAQNNTLVIYTNPVEVASFSAELSEEHATALRQEQAREKK